MKRLTLAWTHVLWECFVMSYPWTSLLCTCSKIKSSVYLYCWFVCLCLWSLFSSSYISTDACHGGHFEIHFDNVHVPANNILLGETNLDTGLQKLFKLKSTAWYMSSTPNDLTNINMMLAWESKYESYIDKIDMVPIVVELDR